MDSGRALLVKQISRDENRHRSFMWFGAPSFGVATRSRAKTEELGIEADVARLLSVSPEKARIIVEGGRRLYVDRMRERFSDLRLSERLKRTNPFLLQIRGAKTVQDWARFQVEGVLFASEEEAVGHLLELIAKTCHPGAGEPRDTVDIDFEVADERTVKGYQVKMSWDCMPMSSRKNLSATVRRLKAKHKEQGLEFSGFFAPCYGRSTTSKPPGQDYITLSSREFWQEVGGGQADFDSIVGAVCALLCSEFRVQEVGPIVEDLVTKLANAATPVIGNRDGTLNFTKLFRSVNK